jgi:hypothetical protein
MWLWKDYKRVQRWHWTHNKHHIEWLTASSKHSINDVDIDAMVIDNECSRLTKNQAQQTAIEYFSTEFHSGKYSLLELSVLNRALIRATSLGLKK